MIHKLTTTNVKKLTGSGKVADAGCEIYAVVLAAGSANATVVIHNSEDNSGTEVLKLAAVASSTEAVSFSHPIQLANGAYATISGTGAEVTVSYR